MCSSPTFSRRSGRNPFQGNFRTSDGGTINLCMVSPTGLIRDTFEKVGVPQAADDPRFKDVLSLIENASAASDILVRAFAARPFDYWRSHLKSMKGQWAPIQNFEDLLIDDQALANDMIIEVEGADGGKPLRLVRGPVQFDHGFVAQRQMGLSHPLFESTMRRGRYWAFQFARSG